MKEPALKRFASGLVACLLFWMNGVANAVPGDGIYAKPGRLVATLDGARLNFYCMGSGSPVVIFDAAEADWAPAWATVQPQVAMDARLQLRPRRLGVQRSGTDAAHRRAVC